MCLMVHKSQVSSGADVRKGNNMLKIEAFMVIGHHTLVLHRQVSVDEVFKGDHAVETYCIAPHAPKEYTDIEALMASEFTDMRHLVIETTDVSKARHAFCMEVMREAISEIDTID